MWDVILRVRKGQMTMINDIIKRNMESGLTPTIEVSGGENVVGNYFEKFECIIKADIPDASAHFLKIQDFIDNSNRQYYSLFVLDNIDFGIKDTFYVEKEYVFKYCCNLDDTRKELATLNRKSIKIIKTMPALFMNVNENFAMPSDKQVVYLGFIEDIKIADDMEGVFIKRYLYSKNKQKIINNMIERLNIPGSSRMNDLDKEQWAIIKCDLLKELGVI